MHRVVKEMLKNVEIAWLWCNKSMTSNDIARRKIVAFLMCQMPDLLRSKLPEHFQAIMVALELMHEQGNINRRNEHKRARHE